MSIFIHTDPDGDTMAVASLDDGRLGFRVDALGCDIDRDAVLRLIQALTEWAYPVHTPEHANRSLIEQLIEKAVKNQVAAVLPLHLAPAAICRAKDCDTARHLTAPVCTIPEHQTDRWGYVDASPNPYATQSSPGLCRDCGDTRPSLALYHACTADGPLYCTIADCTFPSTPGAIHYEHDPEPHDVGHPDVPEATTTGRWEAELRRDAGRAAATPYCAPCGHSWNLHGKTTGCDATLGKGTCPCARTRDASTW